MPRVCRASSSRHSRPQGQQAKRRSAAVASAMDGAGYNSDEEVYAVARAIDAEDEVRLLCPGLGNLTEVLDLGCQHL